MYKVGDKVKIREDLEVLLDAEPPEDTGFTAYDVNGEMAEFAGAIATITEVDPLGLAPLGACAEPCYFINIDNGDYYWYDHCFEGLLDRSDVN